MERQYVCVLAALSLAACGVPQSTRETRIEGRQPGLAKREFGVLDGRGVTLYTLTNRNGMSAAITDYGATLVSMTAASRTGVFEDVVLGFDTLDGFVAAKGPYFGSIVGRYGNRIAKGRFSLNGVQYRLATNNGQNHLHGGIKGFDKVVWKAEESETPEGPAVTFEYVSRDGEEGYPGTLTSRVTYVLTPMNALRIRYEMASDKDTVANLTNHAYFNLTGDAGKGVAGHEFEIRASRYTPVDSGLIPTGDLAAVERTPFDFRKPSQLGPRLSMDHPQIRIANGVDHNFVLDGDVGTLRTVVIVKEPGSGRVLEVLTTEPGVQFYTGNFLDGSLKGRDGKTYGRNAGFCLETQRFPDSPNWPAFPSAIVKAGEKRTSETVFQFRTF
jgi:aldose 1-epimerase